jgi:alkylated DNA repair dioxygenase AlkB
MNRPIFPEQGREILFDDESGRLVYQAGFLKSGLFREFDQELSWRQDQIQMFGRKIALPRLTAWYGDPGTVYVYSGIRNEPLVWSNLLSELRQRLMQSLEHDFNSVLANRYADGTQHMSWHADDEASLGPEPMIASISLGAPRRFVLKHRQRPERVELVLGDGSLLVMAGRLQEEWLHALPKMSRVTEPRINLTFRLVLPS